MASYQDIEMRLTVVEDKLTFLMTNMRMRGIPQGPGVVLGPNGEPPVVEGSVLDWYHLSKNATVRNAADLLAAARQQAEETKPADAPAPDAAVPLIVEG